MPSIIVTSLLYWRQTTQSLEHAVFYQRTAVAAPYNSAFKQEANRQALPLYPSCYSKKTKQQTTRQNTECRFKYNEGYLRFVVQQIADSPAATSVNCQYGSRARRKKRLKTPRNAALCQQPDTDEQKSEASIVVSLAGNFNAMMHETVQVKQAHGAFARSASYRASLMKPLIETWSPWFPARSPPMNE